MARGSSAQRVVRGRAGPGFRRRDRGRPAVSHRRRPEVRVRVRWRPVPGPTMRAALNHMSYVELWVVVVQGKLTTFDLMFHLSAAFFWLFLTVKVLESRKWK